jgi:hypothetical protein
MEINRSLIDFKVELQTQETCKPIWSQIVF